MQVRSPWLLFFPVTLGVAVLGSLFTCNKTSGPDQRSFYALASSGLLIRDLPNQSARVLGQIPYGARVELGGQTFEASAASENTLIDGRSGRWRKVRYKDTEGFAFGGYISSQPIDRSRIERGDFKGLVYYNLPADIQDQGGGLLDEAMNLWTSRIKVKNQIYILLVAEIDRIGPYAEWRVLDQLKIGPLRAGHHASMANSCASITTREQRNEDLPPPDLALVIYGGQSQNTDGRVFVPITAAWQVDQAGKNFAPADHAGLFCEMQGH